MLFPERNASEAANLSGMGRWTIGKEVHLVSTEACDETEEEMPGRSKGGAKPSIEPPCRAPIRPLIPIINPVGSTLRHRDVFHYSADPMLRS